MRLLQYIVFFILVLNGLQPYITEHSGYYDQTTADEVCTSTETNDQEQQEDKSIDTQGEDDLVSNDDSQVIEPKPNDFQTASKGWNGEPEFLTIRSIALQDWVISKEHLVAKIPLALQRHSYFSKRSSDEDIA